MPLSDYSPSELAPRNLTADEIENPYQVIEELFQLGHLPQVRDDLWELLKATVIGSHFKTYSTKERANLIIFYEN